MRDDFRFALRQLRKNPGFAAIAVITLGLGIGAAAAMFGLIQGVLLSPPPYADPDRVMLVTPARTDGRPYTRGATIGQWVSWRQAKSIEPPAVYRWTFNFLVLPDGSQSMGGKEQRGDFQTFELTLWPGFSACAAAFPACLVEETEMIVDTHPARCARSSPRSSATRWRSDPGRLPSCSPTVPAALAIASAHPPGAVRSSARRASSSACFPQPVTRARARTVRSTRRLPWQARPWRAHSSRRFGALAGNTRSPCASSLRRCR